MAEVNARTLTLICASNTYRLLESVQERQQILQGLKHIGALIQTCGRSD